MKVLILVTCSIWAVNAASFLAGTLEEWMLFKQKYNKTYPSDIEEKFRMKIYMDNKLFIEKHNEKFEKGEVTFELGVNKYSDMLHEEFKKIVNGFKMSNGEEYVRNLKGTTFKIPSNVIIPNEINWVEKGAVTPVKDQGTCGSCWAFSSTGALEGQHFRKNGTLVSLSEQNLVDCSVEEGNSGCHGGWMSYAFTYIEKNGGIDTESSYPYEGIDSFCRYDPTHSGATDNGYVNVKSGDEEALKAAVATIGPISVAIDVGRTFQFYQRGVYVDAFCSSSLGHLDHAVLVVGYGTDNETNEDYWLVKNSWSEYWGEKGYVRMLRNANNQCGIATIPVYPSV